MTILYMGRPGTSGRCQRRDYLDRDNNHQAAEVMSQADIACYASKMVAGAG